MKVRQTSHWRPHPRWSIAFAATVVLCAAHSSVAQVSLATAVDLALRNSPRVKSSEADVNKARAVLDETKDVFIPSATAGAGIGQSYGYSPNPPTLFNVNAQSLLYNGSQFSYIHSARAGFEAANRSLDDIREVVAEDAALTFIALDHDQQREEILRQQAGFSSRLVQIVQDRFDAGQDTSIDLTNARLSAAQLHLAQLHAQDETANDRAHLARLMGIPPGSLHAEEGFPSTPISATPLASTDGYANASVAAAFATARAKQLQAKGDSHTLYRPQLSFVVQYNRYATFTDSFKRIQGIDNVNKIGADEGVFGVSITLPLFDRYRRSKNLESAADAQRALHDAEFAQAAVLDAQEKLSHTIAELQARAEVAALEQQLAQQQLEVVELQLNSPNAAPQPATPKEQQNARIAEREKYLAVIDRTFELRQAEVSLLRQTGHLQDWLRRAVPPPPKPAPTGP